MSDRREFLTASMLLGSGILVPSNARRAFALPIPGGSLDPALIQKYQMPLVIPPAMPRTRTLVQRGGGPVDYYEIAVRQFRQQILPMGMPRTTVWSYGSVNHSATFNYPAFTIEADFRRPVRVKWINGLKDGDGAFLKHILAVDPTLIWANPPGGLDGRDERPVFTGNVKPYVGPVPIVTHLHGGHSAQESDGFASAWYLPEGSNIPAHFAPVGAEYARFKDEFFSKFHVSWEPGTATFQYENDQRATTMWYHDHTLGMTRLNVYAGPAGFYLLRKGPGDLPAGVLPGPAPEAGADPLGRFFEIPLAIQDRSFAADGSLFYPDTRELFDGFAGPYIPHSDVPPIWNPEAFGNTIVVNGRTWPFLAVEQRRYRLRVLNGCNSRFLILKIVRNPRAARPATPALALWQIGADGGFLPRPVQLDQLLLAPAERADVIVDFTKVSVGTAVYLINEGPDEPFSGGVPQTDFPAADVGTTGQVMKFVVEPVAGKDRSSDPAHLTLPAFRPLGPASHVRQVSLNELASTVRGFDGPIAALLGTLDNSENPVPKGWGDPVTENPALHAVEIWEIYNFTEDAHPIHIHEVQFQIVDRQPFAGMPREPESGELGFKDTVIAYPGEITRIKALFDLPGPLHVALPHC